MAAGALYLLWAPATTAWLDSPELLAASVGLGNSHPPGSCVSMLLNQLATLLPLGPLDLRVHGAAALTLAVVVWLVAALARELGSSVAGAVAAALVFACSSAALTHGTRVEVYGLEAALGLGATLAALVALRRVAGGSSGGRSPFLLAAFLGGLATTLHPLIAAATVAPAAAAVTGATVVRLRRSVWRWLGPALALTVVALAVTLYLPMRALQRPTVNWGDPRTLERFGWVVSARLFAQATRHAKELGLAQLRDLSLVLTEELALGWLLGALGLGGAWATASLRRHHRAIGVVIAMALLTLGARLVVGFDPAAADDRGYLLPLLAALCTGVGLLVTLAQRIAHPTWRRRAAAALLLGVAANAAAQLGVAATSQGRGGTAQESSGAMGRALLAEVPPGGVLVSSHFETTFLLWYQRVVEGARPDVVLLPRNFLSQPGARLPEALEGAGRRAGPTVAERRTAPPRDLDLPWLDRLAALRPLRIEPDLNLSPGVAQRLLGDGLLWRLAPGGAGREDQRRAADSADLAWRAVLRSWVDDDGSSSGSGDGGLPVEAARYALWQSYVRAATHCAVDRREAAERDLGRALELAPRSPEVAELGRRCGAAP